MRFPSRPPMRARPNSPLRFILTRYWIGLSEIGHTGRQKCRELIAAFLFGRHLPARRNRRHSIRRTAGSLRRVLEKVLVCPLLFPLVARGPRQSAAKADIN